MTPVSRSRYAALLPGTCPRRAGRRNTRWTASLTASTRAVVVTGCVLSVWVLAGCSPAAVSDPGGSTSGAIGSPSVAPSNTSAPPSVSPTRTLLSTPPATLPATPRTTLPIAPSSAASSAARSTALSTAGGSTSGVSTTPPPPGTVVPFRTVAPDSATGLRIGMIAPTGSDAFGKEVTVSIAAQLKAAGADLVRCDPGDDAALTLDCARRFATQQVDGWIVLQSAVLGTALCEAGPQDVPLIVIAGAPLDCQTASVGADDRRAGFLAGQALGLAARSKTECRHDTFVLVTDGAAETVSADRVAGIREGFMAICPDGPTQEMLLDAGTQELAYDSFGTALSTVPTDAVILAAAVNDAAALGMTVAVPDARREQVSMVAIGADLSARCEISADQQWIGDAALFPDRYGEVVVPAMLDALHGRSVPARMFVESSFVTAADIGAPADLTDCPGR